MDTSPKVYVRRERSPRTSVTGLEGSRVFRVNEARRQGGTPPPELHDIPSTVTVRAIRPTSFVRSESTPETGTTPKYRIKAAGADSFEKTDRRVEDLEISNRSLLSVNRYLDRRIRRQTEEITNLSELLRQRGGWNSSELVGVSSPEPGSDDDTFDSGDHIQRAARRKTMSHIEILKAAESADQALHRCIYVTERLLKDAQEAYNYNVQAEDIKLGGKVLVDSEETSDDNGGENEGLEEDDDSVT